MRILRGVANRLCTRDATRNAVDRVPHSPLSAFPCRLRPGLTPPPYIGVISLHRTVTVSAMSVRSARTQASVARSGRRSGCNFLISLSTVRQPCWSNTRCPRVLTALRHHRTPKTLAPCQAVALGIPRPSGGSRSGGRPANRRRTSARSCNCAKVRCSGADTANHPPHACARQHLPTQLVPGAVVRRACGHGLRHPPYVAGDRTRTQVMLSKIRQMCCAARAFPPNST